MAFLLLLSILTLLTGPLLLHFAEHHVSMIRFLDSFVVFSVFGLVAFHIMPESIHEAGIWAIIAAAVGLFAPILIGPYLRTGECRIPTSIISLASIGLIAHAILDGAAISTASLNVEQSGFLLGIAVVLHRLPEGVGIWRVTRSQYSAMIGVLVLGALIVAVIVGYFFGGQLLNRSSETALTIFQSLMAGTLLHVIFHRHHLQQLTTPLIHGHADAHPAHAHGGQVHRKSKGWRASTILGAVTGILLVAILLSISHPDSDDSGEPTNGHTAQGHKNQGEQP